MMQPVVKFLKISTMNKTLLYCRRAPMRFAGCAYFIQSQKVSSSTPFLTSSHLAHTAAESIKTTSRETDLKLHAVDIFNSAIKSVSPKAMIENVLFYNQSKGILNVHSRPYKIQKNVFIVGFGNSVLGMARVVEDMLGEHVVTGIISIPSGIKQEMVKESSDESMTLSSNTKIHVYEVAGNSLLDEAGYNASKAIHQLVSKLTAKDVLIVLCSAGGSALCPSPHPPITLNELHQTIQLLKQNKANSKELNTVQKTLEILKGGGLALAARPAKVISLILSSVLGDKADLVASGPTCLNRPCPPHCLEILQRLGIIEAVPDSVRRFLDREAKQLSAQKIVQDPNQAMAERDALWQDIQNVIVGSNSIACQAAVSRATELGYFPLILTTVLTGQARDIGALFAKLAKFIMICYDSRASMASNSELSKLEVELVAGGIKKQWINHIATSVYKANNMNKDICIISGGEINVEVAGNGIGGKNTESALSAAIHIHEELRAQPMNVTECPMCYLSCDSDGIDGMTKVAGAVVDQDFLDEVGRKNIDMLPYLSNNDSYTLFTKVNHGKNLIRTNLTGTDIMDLVVLMVKKPSDKKFNWN